MGQSDRLGLSSRQPLHPSRLLRRVGQLAIYRGDDRAPVWLAQLVGKFRILKRRHRPKGAALYIRSI
jgi:hypothetical protein